MIMLICARRPLATLGNIMRRNVKIGMISRGAQHQALRI